MTALWIILTAWMFGTKSSSASSSTATAADGASPRARLFHPEEPR